MCVMTFAALPRNHVNAVKSRTWRRFLLLSALQTGARRIVNLSNKSVVEGIFSHSLGGLLAFLATPEGTVSS
jgi:hypothetical protein